MCTLSFSQAVIFTHAGIHDCTTFYMFTMYRYVLMCWRMYQNLHSILEICAPDCVFRDVFFRMSAHGCPCSWVCIGLVLVGVVACVSMAVAVWSIAEVHTISNSCEAWKESGTAEAVGQVNSESIHEIEEMNATFTDAINFLSQNDDQLNATLTHHWMLSIIQSHKLFQDCFHQSLLLHVCKSLSTPQGTTG